MRKGMNAAKALAMIALLAGMVLGAYGADEAKKDAKDLAPLELQLPKPIFIGTPKNVTPSPHLEMPSAKPREPFLAPKGTINLAKGKTVTSSTKDPLTGELAMLTDDDKAGTDGTFVELDRGLQWAQIDLGQPAQIYAIVIWHFHSDVGRIYHDVIVQVSDDPDFIKDVKTVYNNDYDNTAGMGIGKDKEYFESYEGRLIDAHGVKGRYVRCYSNGNTSNEENHYVEVAVYGKPAK